MPVYEYQCSSCGRIEEALQKISDPPLTVCPECHGSLKKLISLNSFQLKGSGWYVTDYGKSNTGGGKKTSSKSTATTSTSSESKSTTSPEKISVPAGD